MTFGNVDTETSKTPVPKDGCAGEMLKFDTSFLYVPWVVIIDFGPDDVFSQAERPAFYWRRWMVRASSIEKSEKK
jgi:hypothetical protein